MDQFCGSPFWDWDLTWNTDNPVFTPCFERTVLAFAAPIFLWIFGPLDIYFSYSSIPSRSYIPWSALSIGKLGLATLLIILEMGSLVFSTFFLPVADSSRNIYPVDIYGPILRAVTLLLYMGLLLYSKNRGICSSGVQFLFWLLLSLTQAVRFRTLILRLGPKEFVMDPLLYSIEVAYFPLVVGQFILHCWADVAPIHLSDYKSMSTKTKNITPEPTASFLSELLFEWFTPLVWKGFKKPLEYSDLWYLNWSETSQHNVALFDRNWPKNLNPGLTIDQKQGKHSKTTSVKSSPYEAKEAGVLLALTKTFGWVWIIAYVIRTVTNILLFVSPQILNLLIDFVSSSNEPTWKGLLYASILFLSAFIGTIFAAYALHMYYVIGIRAKISLTSAVYRKALLLSSSARRAESLGEIVNHMAVDINYITEFSQMGHQLWSAPIIIAIALYFLWNILGPSSLAGMAVIIVILPLNALIASQTQKLQKQQMLWKDKRTKLMNEILSGMKVIKLYAWEPSFENQVTNIRNEELRVLRKTAYFNSISDLLWTCAPFLVAVATFGTYVLIDDSRVLDAQTAFVSLSLFNIMSQSLTFFPFLISAFIQAFVAVKRLNKYMNAEELIIDAVSHCDDEMNPIVIENGYFSWDNQGDSGNATLKEINFQVKEGELVAIVGGVGSGKSSLLSCLLNELAKIRGRVNIKGDIAYVAQQAWIQNGSVRDNILFGKPYDTQKYRRVVEACALRPDLEILAAGDKTEIGEKGINLSGGQKQRIALARAVYSNASVYLLDDPLSAVDAHVGKHIFDKVIGPKGMLRRKTRLLVTHGIVYLPLVNNIFVMLDGRISEEGTYQQLLDKKGAFSDFLKQHSSSSSSSETDLAEETVDKITLKTESVAESLRKRTGTATHSETEEEIERQRRLSNVSISGSYAASIAHSGTGNQLIEAETSETSSVKASVYLDYMRAAGWTMVFGSCSLYFVFQVFSVGSNLWLSEWTSNVPIENGNDKNYNNQTASKNSDYNQTFYLGIYGSLGLFQGIAILFASLVVAMGTVKSSNVLHSRMLVRIMRAPLSFFDVTPLGRIVNRFSKDVDSMDNVLPLILRYMLSGTFNVLATLVVISVSTPVFALVIPPVGLLYYFVQRFYIATSRQLKRLESVTRSPIYSHFGETISGASTIRAFKQQARFVEEMERRVDHNLRSYYCSVSSNRWLQVRLETVGNSVVFFAALFAVLGRETLSPGIVGLSVSYALQITGALLVLVRITSDMETNIVAVERLKEYSNVVQEATWETKDPFLVPEKSWPQQGKIVFDSYQTRYRPGLDLVLKNLTCTINCGEKVGIVGRTGAGKSSMTLAIFRIVEAAGGSITVDGKDISRLGLHDVRGRITIIPQDPVLFSGSLRINLDPFELESDETLYRTLELAHLKNFFVGLQGGLDYEIAEGGENLSVGQRQLVCLARALLRKTKILVLDEATAAVDLDTDELIQQTIRKEFKESTVITIAHRLNTIMDSDRVIVLENGEIQEFDSPQNLLANENSIFSQMSKETETNRSS
ncbi:unnamed protein product [Orchesella dallaii]|uniref:ABC-type glutathione-S-conjugate transporter n=1 Tax=Orchesella dallaii TaxID=48710 RepID=A0ABP1S842_9HEXA